MVNVAKLADPFSLYVVHAMAARDAFERRRRRAAERHAAIEAELEAMGVQGRARRAHAVISTPTFGEMFDRATDAAKPADLNAARALMLDMLAERGVDVAGVTMRMVWNPPRDLRVTYVGADPDAVDRAVAAIEARAGGEAKAA